MKSLRPFLLSLLVIAVAAPVWAAARECTGPDSFLKYRARTVSDFMAEWDSDPVLRQRLAKHYHMSEAELGSYFRTNLRIVTVQQSGWITTYGVTRTGRIYKTRDYLHKGAKMFGLPDGTPVLKLPCGNPLTTTLPLVKREVRHPKPLPEVAATVEQPLPPAPVIPPPAPVPTQSPEEVALVSEVPVAPVVVPPLATEESRRAFPWWVPTLALPFLGESPEHHHIIPPPVPPVVPEPSSLLFLAAGAALLGGWAKRRRMSSV